MTDARTEALRYVGIGVPVFPVHWPSSAGGCSCRLGTRCENVGKHPIPRNGVLDATLDAELVDQVWRKASSANVGLATGFICDVLDIDSPEAIEGLQRAVAEHYPDIDPGFLLAADPPVVRTGKGWHVYYRSTGEGNRARMIPGVDWRGRGGYVLGPPSLHASGKRYEWGGGVLTAELPEAPAPLLEMVRRQGPWEARKPEQDSPVPEGQDEADLYARLDLEAPRGGGLEGVYRVMSEAQEGERNHVLFWCANRVVDDVMRGRLSQQEASAVFTELAELAAAVGLQEFEIERTVRSAMRGARR